MREDGERTIQLNVPEAGAPASSGFFPATFWDASADGERAFFTTREPLTADATVTGSPQLYMWSAAPYQGHHLTLLSVDREPADAGGEVKFVIGASADGSRVYFLAKSQLVAGGPAFSKEPGIYLWHEGVVSYVGSRVGAIFAEGEFASAGIQYSGRQARVSADGTHLLFPAYEGAGLTGYDHGPCTLLNAPGCRELYLYDAEGSTPTEPDLECVSCRPDMAPATASAGDVLDELHGDSQEGEHETHPLSADGRYVFFSTAEALVPEDTNGVEDAYEYDTRTEEVHLLSSGTGELPSWFLDASADGSDVFFATAQPLVGWDHDVAYDLYDARVGGGFPEPTPTAAPCAAADTCRAPAGQAPAPATSGSGIQGPGNPQTLSRSHCPRRKRARTEHGQTVCVKKRKGHHHHRRRPAHHRKGGRR